MKNINLYFQEAQETLCSTNSENHIKTHHNQTVKTKGQERILKIGREKLLLNNLFLIRNHAGQKALE